MKEWIIIGAILAGLIVGGDTLLRNLLAYLSWLFHPLFQPGDTVEIGRYRGIVEAIGWQRIRLCAPSGERISIPNAVALNQPVVQSIPGPASQEIEIFFRIPEEIELSRARRAAEQAVMVSPYLALDRAIEVSLAEGERGETVVRARAGVFDASQRTRFETAAFEIFRAYLEEGTALTRDRVA